MKTVAFAGIILWAALGSGCRTGAGHLPIPIVLKPEKVVGSWIGFTQSQGACYRLSIDAAGTGNLRWLSTHSMTTGDDTITRWEIV